MLTRTVSPKYNTLRGQYFATALLYVVGRQDVGLYGVLHPLQGFLFCISKFDSGVKVKAIPFRDNNRDAGKLQDFFFILNNVFEIFQIFCDSGIWP